jgi:hypothetical protein
MSGQLQNDELKQQYLYRYFATKWAESLLAQGKMYFPSPADFNDPFDCKARVTYGSRRQRRLHAQDLIRERLRNLPKPERQRLLKRGAKIEAYQKSYEGFLKRLHEQVGVLSFSEKGDNVLMWSHYAAKHTGLCVEFKHSGYMNFALQVGYTQEYPTLDYLRAVKDMKQPLEARYVIDRLYLTKAEDWKYEREWRLMALAAPIHYVTSPRVPRELVYGGKGLHEFPTELTTRVILGCRMPDNDKEQVKGWVRSGPAKPTLWQAREADGFFRLDFVDI